MNPSHSRRFVWFGSGQPMPESREHVRAAILCFTSALSATLWLIALGFQKQLALGTNDFDVTCGHLMVVMTAKLFLKRQQQQQQLRSVEPARRSFLWAASSHTPDRGHSLVLRWCRLNLSRNGEERPS